MEESSLNLFKNIRDKIKPIYNEEADSIAMLIVEKLTGFSNTEILVGKSFTLTSQSGSKIDKYLCALKNHIPVQYILGEVDFYGHKFYVNKEVLIPRPETEELVRVVSYHLKDSRAATVVDIGTGSGCIAISLALLKPDIKLSAIDISEGALEIAIKNAHKYSVDIEFEQVDVADFTTDIKYNVIVSNPPYVTESEKGLMRRNVLDYEPSNALFVSDDDPLYYYKIIVDLAKTALHDSGAIFLEINERYGKEVEDLLIGAGLKETKILKDINRKDRIVCGQKK